jgi:tetratricopeptide (TPR) repeat protein
VIALRLVRGRLIPIVLLVALVAAIGMVGAVAQGADDLAALRGRVSQLHSQGKYAEAVPFAEQYVGLARQKFGEENGEFALAVSWLANVYNAQGRYAEAEPLYKRSLAIREKMLGPDHPDVGTSLNNLAGLYDNQGRAAEAEPLYKRSLAIRENTLGSNHALVASSLNNLALLYKNQGRYAEAEPLYKRSLAIREKMLGSDHLDVGTALNNLATLYRAQGRYGEAEPLYQRSLAIKEKAVGPDHPSIGTALNNLALLYDSQGRYVEAEPLYRRAIAINEKALGPDHPSLATALNNLALLYWAQRRYGEAEPLYKRTVSIYDKALGPDHTSVGTALNNLAELYESQGRFTEAEPLYKRSLAIHEKALGSDHPDVALNNLAALYDSLGRYSEAEPLYKRDLAIREKTLGPDHPTVGTSLSNLAGLYFAQRDWQRAADNWRRSTTIVARRSLRGTPDLGQSLTGKRKREIDQVSYQFRGLVKAAHHVATQNSEAALTLQREMFQTAQWAQGSEAANSLAQMAARGAKGNPNLATIVRERQDLVSEWQNLDAARIAALSQPPDKRNRAAETAGNARLAAIDRRISEIDKRLTADFADYAALSRPEPLSVEEVQAQLYPDEAIVLFLDTPEWKPTPEETFIWVVTKTNMRWARSELGTPALMREVAALRCGLDAALWDDDATQARCRDLVKAAPQRGGLDTVIWGALPFDTARAQALYKALFGGVEDLIRDKHLLIVPSGPLTQLPFQVLVTTSTAANGDYSSTAWLARTHAITVLPAISSLRSLRRIARPSAATKLMIGFGNPLLDGNPRERAWEAQWAALARDKACKDLPLQQVATATHKTRGVLKVARRDGHADLTDVRSLMPLPDTADERAGWPRISSSLPTISGSEPGQRRQTSRR